MEPAAQPFGRAPAGITVRAPRITYLSAVDAAVHADPEDIRALLACQLARPVRWSEAIRAILATGVQVLIEWPGKVLTDSIGASSAALTLLCLALEDDAAIKAALNASAGAVPCLKIRPR